MPEGDTIHRTAAMLRPALVGKTVLRFDAPRLVGPRPRPGSAVEAVEAHGKHLEVTFDDGLVLHTHLRMTGSWHLYRPGERWRKHPAGARVVLGVEGWLAVCFHAPVVEAYPGRDRRRHPILGSLGPDLCRPGADIGACVERMARYATLHERIGDLLLDQRVACGVGNVYKSEVLWACRLDPWSPIEFVTVEARHELLATAARLLQANLGVGERTTVPGGLAVYRRAGKPCLRCRTTVEARRQGDDGRLTYWCPGCQWRPGPPAHLARPQARPASAPAPGARPDTRTIRPRQVGAGR